MNDHLTGLYVELFFKIGKKGSSKMVSMWLPRASPRVVFAVARVHCSSALNMPFHPKPW